VNQINLNAYDCWFFLSYFSLLTNSEMYELFPNKELSGFGSLFSTPM
jgi:hypothetical protein